MGRNSKGQVSINFNYKVNFKDFFPKFMCYLTSKDTKHIEQDFHSVAWIIPQGWDLRVCGGQKCDFSEHGHVAYQIEGRGW